MKVESNGTVIGSEFRTNWINLDSPSHSRDNEFNVMSVKQICSMCRGKIANPEVRYDLIHGLPVGGIRLAHDGGRSVTKMSIF